MDTDGQEQPDPRHPQQPAGLMEEFCVTVDLVRVGENLEVADQMADDKPEQNHAGDGHENFPADGGAE